MKPGRPCWRSMMLGYICRSGFRAWRSVCTNWCKDPVLGYQVPLSQQNQGLSVQPSASLWGFLHGAVCRVPQRLERRAPGGLIPKAFYLEGHGDLVSRLIMGVSWVTI